MMRLHRGLLAASLASLVACGGGEYGSLDLFVLSGDEAYPGYTADLVVPHGGAWLVEARPRAAQGDDFRGWEVLELHSMNPVVAEIRPSILSHIWVVTGASPGTTHVSVEFDGRERDRFIVTVVEQD